MSYLKTRGASLSLSSYLRIPEKIKKVSRYVFLVDMSFSNISGPCPQDVDSNLMFKRGESRKPVNGFDPNKLLNGRVISDYEKVMAFDCYVDPGKVADDFPLTYRPISSLNDLTGGRFRQNPTIPGSDFNAYRLSVVKQWIAQLRDILNEEQKKATQVLIVPYTSGYAKDRLYSQVDFDFNSRFRFYSLDGSDSRYLDQLLIKLERVHNEARRRAMDRQNFHRWKNRKMGASSPTETLSPLERVLKSDMEILTNMGLLRRTSYHLFLISDGRLTPLKEQIDLAVQSHYRCNSCRGNSCSDRICHDIRTELEKSVGSADLNNKVSFILKMGRIQSLSNYFGAGRIFNYFTQINPSYYQKVYLHGVDDTHRGEFLSLFEILSMEFDKYDYKHEYFKIESNTPPLNLGANQVESKNFSLNGIIVLNPNIRVAEDGSVKYDSDADGLFDSDEKLHGTDPLNPRSNGVCLDSLAHYPAFSEKCNSYIQAPDCSAFLDTDMDSLNECEERILGTNPFDFDTDDDMIPDYFEWIYGFNPIMNEKKHDTNGDGDTNLKAFLAGLGPNHSFGDIDERKLVKFSINEEKAEKKVGDLWINKFKLHLDNIPHGTNLLNGSMSRSEPCFLYHSHVPGDLISRSCENNAIGTDKLFFQTVERKGLNKGLILLRLRDKDNESNIVWKIMKFDFDHGKGSKVFGLTEFDDFDVIDEVGD